MPIFGAVGFQDLNVTHAVCTYGVYSMVLTSIPGVVLAWSRSIYTFSTVISLITLRSYRAHTRRITVVTSVTLCAFRLICQSYSRSICTLFTYKYQLYNSYIADISLSTYLIHSWFYIVHKGWYLT